MNLSDVMNQRNGWTRQGLVNPMSNITLYTGPDGKTYGVVPAGDGTGHTLSEFTGGTLAEGAPMYDFDAQGNLTGTRGYKAGDSSVLGTVTGLAKDVAPFVLGSLAMYGGVNALSGLTGGAGAAGSAVSTPVAGGQAIGTPLGPLGSPAAAMGAGAAPAGAAALGGGAAAAAGGAGAAGALGAAIPQSLYGTLVAGGASILGGVLGANGARDAARTQADAINGATNASVGEQRRQFDTVMELLAPYRAAGPGALTAYQNLSGVNGAAPQQAAIDALTAGPEFSSLYRQGEDAILQNAAATGGLRGGNTQAALAKFRPQLLTALIDRQLGRYGDLTRIGQNSAAGSANAAMTAGQGISGALMNGGMAAGQAQAGGQMAGTNALVNTVGNVGGLLAARIAQGGF